MLSFLGKKFARQKKNKSIHRALSLRRIGRFKMQSPPQIKLSLTQISIIFLAVSLLFGSFATASLPRDIGGGNTFDKVRYKSIAQLASAEDYSRDDIRNYNPGENLTIIDGDYLLKTAPAETIISRNSRTKIINYEVKAGESVGSLAIDFGISSTTIRYVNGLSSNSLKVGQKLIIPPLDGIIYSVRRGDTISGIAKKFRVSQSNILKYNQLGDGASIHAGDKIFVPGAVVSRSTSSKVAMPSFIPSGNTQFAWPTANPTHYISQLFGHTRFNPRHTGIDLTRLNGTGIYASAAGVATISSYRRGYGNLIIINHGNGWKTYYAHLSAFAIKNGAYVQQGQLIGYMGATGWATGPHLHFEIRKNEIPQNPLSYLPR